RQKISELSLTRESRGALPSNSTEDTSASRTMFTAFSPVHYVEQAQMNVPARTDGLRARCRSRASASTHVYRHREKSISAESMVATKSRSSGSKLEDLIELQTFQGFWEWNQMLFECIRLIAVDAEKAVKDNGWDKRIVATALAIAFMKKRLCKEKEAWELIADKANGWLEEKIGQNEIAAVMLVAEKLIN
ncbi:hypothetical protein BGX27_005229, partial [Mortierella sp. AM989]